MKLTLVSLALLFAGCADVARMVEAMGKDPANVCGSISTPYGGGVAGRVNTPGARMSISGGQCVIETPSPR